MRGRPRLESQFSDDRLREIARWYFSREKTSTQIAELIEKRRQDVRRLALAGQKLLNASGPPGETGRA